MADDTQLNPGVGGDVIATDDIGGVKTQRVKLTLGADGVNDGDVSSGNPIPADLTTVAGTVPPTGPGVSANALRVELPTNGQGRVFTQNTPVATAPGGTTTIVNNDTSAPIVAANASRKSVLIFNDGFEDVFIGVGEAATLAHMRLIAQNYLSFECVGAINAFNPSTNTGPIGVRFTDESY